jgi:pyridoxal phosphate enzyme (YggS family)
LTYADPGNSDHHRAKVREKSNPRTESTMSDLANRIDAVLARIRECEDRFHRQRGSVALLAVSKLHPASAVATAAASGLHRFGENYLQEALDKMQTLSHLNLEWHFIGPIQSNKTRGVAEHFAWAQSVDRLKIAQRLNAQRPDMLPPLNICLQVNISGEDTKSGLDLEALPDIAEAVAALPRLRLRGLMAIPVPSGDFAAQRREFARLREAWARLCRQGLELDTLSMGMSGDLEAAIAEGATLVRLGTAIFGPRPPKP